MSDHLSHHHALYPEPSPGIASERQRLAPAQAETFRAFSQKVFLDGALTAKTKQLIAVAAAHVTQCPYCIRSHTSNALRKGATAEEVMEAIWVAVEMRAGAAYAHSALALDTIAAVEERKRNDHEDVATETRTE
jgi:AhpD family alkylhydroperoxidase